MAQNKTQEPATAPEGELGRGAEEKSVCGKWASLGKQVRNAGCSISRCCCSASAAACLALVSCAHRRTDPCCLDDGRAWPWCVGIDRGKEPSTCTVSPTKNSAGSIKRPRYEQSRVLRATLGEVLTLEHLSRARTPGNSIAQVHTLISLSRSSGVI